MFDSPVSPVSQMGSESGCAGPATEASTADCERATANATDAGTADATRTHCSATNLVLQLPGQLVVAFFLRAVRGQVKADLALRSQRDSSGGRRLRREVRGMHGRVCFRNNGRARNEAAVTSGRSWLSVCEKPVLCTPRGRES